MREDTWFIEHVGHHFAICAVPFKSEAAAVAEALRSCRDAIETRVIFVPAGCFSGTVTHRFGCSAKALP